MKKFAWLLVLPVFLIIFLNRAPINSYASNLLYKSSCDTPLTYKLGSIDSRFNITNQQFLSDIQKAGYIWSTAENKNLFTYKPDGEITINLVYDQRQFLNSQINQMDTSVKEKQKNLDPEIADYKARAAAFNEKIAQLNSDIQYWNNKGGAPPDEYEKLKSRQSELQQQASKLQAEAASLNQSTAQYNTQVGELQNTVATFNQELQYKPEEGVYVVENGKKRIDIYFDNSQVELVHTLAHEMGHALGMGHNENVASIMFPRTTDALVPSVDDVSALTSACKKRSIFQNIIDRYSYIFSLMKQRFAK